MNQRHEPQKRRDVMNVNHVPRVDRRQPVSDSPVQWPGETPRQNRVPLSRVRSLLVALDGSAAAEHALPYALAIARRSGASIRLVHVHSLRDSDSFWPHSEELIQRLRRQKLAYMQSVLRRVRQSVDVQIAAMVIESDKIAHALCEAAAGAALVVMATHGRSFLGRLFYGSVANTLMRTSPCPLLLVRSKGSPVDLNSDPMPRHVLVPLDGTQIAEGVFEAAAAIGSLGGARFTLAHLQQAAEDQFWPDRSDARGYLQEATTRFKLRVPHVNTKFVISDQRTPTAILSLMADGGMDMVAMTTQGRGGLARLVKGSVAAAVARRAETPVLVVGPSAQKAKRPDRTRCGRGSWR